MKNYKDLADIEIVHYFETVQWITFIVNVTCQSNAFKGSSTTVATRKSVVNRPKTGFQM